MKSDPQPSQIKSAQSAEVSPYRHILLVGTTGAGKTAQIWTLPGRKLVFVFDPNTISTLAGCPNCDLVEFYPDFLEVDATLKGFNKGAKSDKSSSVREPTLYMRWLRQFNTMVEDGTLGNYGWLVFDSLTFLSKAVMDRQLYINNRYGDIEDLGDYRVVGSKISDVFNSISSLPINTFCTGHLSTFQDEHTKKIMTQIFLPGKARNMLPLTHTDVWMAFADEKSFKLRTMPEARKGLQEIRSSIRGLKEEEDVTIKDFAHAGDYGIGALLKRSTKSAVH